MASRFDHEVAVVGGGPAGSSAAAMLAKLGRDVLLVECEPFPRFHIGESLLPRNADVFEILGVREKIEAAGFVEKWGANFQTADGTLEAYVDFARAAEIEQPRAWQVLRASFDSLLLEHAKSCGAKVERGRVVSIDVDGGGATLVSRGADEAQRAIRVQCVVDAGGRQSILGRREGRRRMEPRLDNVAIHAQYEGIPRKEGRRSGDIRMVTRRDAGWSWFIPLDERVTSVGIVLPKSIHQRSGGAGAAECLDRYLLEMPAARALLADARRISEPRFDADYSYLADVHAGDRWVAVGDAAAFLDPVFSTGVLLGMEGGVAAARSIDDGLRANDLSRRRFVAFEAEQRRRYEHFKRFVVAFYDPSFRALFFRPDTRFGTVEAVLSILAGNWRPRSSTRLRVELFFLLVALQRRFRFLDETPVREAPEVLTAERA